MNGFIREQRVFGVRLCHVTTYRWMLLLSFCHETWRKGYYVNGHEKKATIQQNPQCNDCVYDNSQERVRAGLYPLVGVFLGPHSALKAQYL
jgi:hypothetical protein